MSKLKVPSLQHLARNWRDTPIKVSNELIKLVENPPTFNYNPLHSAIRDMLILKVQHKQIEEGVIRAVKREVVRNNYLEILSLCRDYFEGVLPHFIQSVERRFYPVGRGLLVPFEPPLIYGVNGQLHFPWFSFWRKNPLADRHLQLFASIVYEVLLQDPDLEEARFVILDFSAAKQNHPRELNVIDARDIPRLSKSEIDDMLAVFAEGFTLAEQKIKQDEKQKNKQSQEINKKENQISFNF
ncbi:hypothetical protein [Insolitispirillum peregrinum]|uniref:Uncharacterized protein n=1 Tax=Insolitispirillum peregrinum TaxID=80876 RepID=A0A1N7NDZ9_9PROT|nr:hypothetical protein [Insolitispirillum peregrinum]SIS96633.1 hypothetical protein SAMN05421779_10559 [Insolitispirillum peregrinum]